MPARAKSKSYIGRLFGNYEVVGKLGEGGMGTVYLAEHPRIGKKVALKVLHNEFLSNPDAVARFLTEARAVNEIQHPNIVDIVDYGEVKDAAGNDEAVYFIMEFLAGESIAALIERSSHLDVDRVLAICLQIASALAASHRRGFVHRDLKPDNVFLTQVGRQKDFVKVLDFGIAKLTGGQEGSGRTNTGVVIGTPYYMSPEQCEGRANVDHTTDIYALGVLMFEMLTGRVPYGGSGFAEVLLKHRGHQPPRPSQLVAEIPAHIDALCLKALEKEQHHRYASMEEFIEALTNPAGYVASHGGVTGFLTGGAQLTLPVNNPHAEFSQAFTEAFAFDATVAPGPMAADAVAAQPSSPIAAPAAGAVDTPGYGLPSDQQTERVRSVPRRLGLSIALSLLVVAAGVGMFAATQQSGGTSPIGNSEQSPVTQPAAVVDETPTSANVGSVPAELVVDKADETVSDKVEGPEDDSALAAKERRAKRKAQRRAEREAKAEEEARAKAADVARAVAKAESDALAATQAEAEAKAAREAKANADREAKAKADVGAKLAAEAEAKAKAERRARARAKAAEAARKARNGKRVVDDDILPPE